ncbi:MAG: YgjV family protein [Treponemataceae bacterium]|nr:YgjV family protein [Treponemataceae bacterium]
MEFLLCGIVPTMNTVIEWFGLVASVIVAISLTMKNLVRLRLVNLVGSSAFALYGFLIHAWPVFLLNAFIVLVNAFYLWTMQRDSQKAETFEIVEITPHDRYVEHFVNFYREDIRKFFPSFVGIPVEDPDVQLCFILRQTIPVSLVLYKKKPAGEVTILLDYAVPAYRDLKNARFFFEQALSRIAAGTSVVHATAEVPAHGAYLKKIGFTLVGTSGSAQLYTKKL